MPLRCLLLLLCVSLAGFGTGTAAHAQSLGDMCVAAAKQAAAAHNVPEDVLIAISLTETGTRRAGALQPWPWAVNDGGASHWFDTRDDAVAFAYGRYKAGARNFDVGCFQLNFRWHGEAFASLTDMFAPGPNADYAARYLKAQYAETGDWTAAAGRYHSRTEVYARRYRDTFAAHRDRVRSGSFSAAAPAPQRRASTGGLAALAAPAGQSAPGSLVSLGTAGQSILVQGRSLFQ